MKRNLTHSVHLAALAVCLLLSGCGQSGKLYVPGHETGYYRTHQFTSRPVDASITKKN